MASRRSSVSTIFYGDRDLQDFWISQVSSGYLIMQLLNLVVVQARCLTRVPWNLILGFVGISSLENAQAAGFSL